MSLKAISSGKVSGTGTVTLAMPVHKRKFGGALISTDGTNAVSVVVRKTDSEGEQIFSVSTVSPGLFAAPFETGGIADLHYSITGTGGEAMLYEWLS